MLFVVLQWGSLPGWLTLAALVGAALWLPRRGQTGPAIESLESNLRVLERRCEELEQQGKVDAALIAELRGKTDVSLAIVPLVEWSTRHEERAQMRHDAALTVLDLIAQRLGPDPNDVHA